MSFKALVYAYVLGGLTFIPLLICTAVAWTIYTSVPVGDPDPSKLQRKKLVEESKRDEEYEATTLPLNDQAKPRKGWLTVRRTFEERESDGSYVTMMRTFLDSRSKDPKRSRPKDMWYVVLKGNVLYLYEDESMTECEAAIQVSAHEVVIYPEGLLDGELYTKRNAICLKPLNSTGAGHTSLPSVTREMGLETEDVEKKVAELGVSDRKRQKERTRLGEIERITAEAKAEAFDDSTPWFIFVRSCVDMEDWYLALVHAANYSDNSSTLEPVFPVFSPSDMNRLVSTLDEQPDVIPMRWLNALIGRIFFSFYRTKKLEYFIIGRLMKKLSKVKMPSFLQNVSVTEVSVGNAPPTFSKPMLKDLTKEGDAALEIRVMYKGEIRVTVEATAIINLGQRFRTYAVKLVLAVVLRKLEGNLLVKVKRPPTNRVWYAFTQPPEMDLDVEPVVSDRQIKWGMICSTLESRLKEVINESVVLPNMDDIAFFESSPFMHRGGIWADASRKTRSTPERPEPAAQSDSAIDNNDDIPTATLSTDALMKTNTSVSTDPTFEVDGDRPESASAPTLVQEPSPCRSLGNDSRGDSSLHEDDGESRSDTMNQLPDSEDHRGRTLNVDTMARRATSVPASKSSSAETPGQEDELTLQSETTLSSETLRDSSSNHSRARALSSGANVLGSDPTASTGESSNTRGANASFLSTLRSKADKQAISNTAKEAMRKWSVNWNGFKREHMRGQNNTEEIADGASSSSFQALGRNFAEIRAAVNGRKEGGSEEDRDASSSSLPIDIPQQKNDEGSGTSARSSSSALSIQMEPSTSASPHSSPKAPSLLRKEAARATISPPRVTTDTQASENTPVASASILPSPEPNVQAPPIKTQPSQGAVMTIPGIHASHRGDIQSYGYVAPLAPTTTSEGKLRTPTIPPTIQSVYRLFRSPTTNGSVFQQQQEHVRGAQASVSIESHGTSPGPSSTSEEVNDDVTPLSLTPSITDSLSDKATTVSSRPVPPPLPPRSVPAPHPSLTPPPVPPRREVDKSPIVPEADVAIAPSASNVLRLIAEQDETKRKDIETSPDLKPKTTTSNKAKRTSLGARRITSTIVISDESEPILGRDEGKPNGEGSARADEGAARDSIADLRPSNGMDVPSSEQTPPIVEPGKSKPPPLPPRRLSILSSS